MNDSLKNLFCLKTTRSNNFNEEKITDELLEIILNASVRAPNASNRQSYSIIILDDKDKKELGLKGDKVLLYLVDFYRHELLKNNTGSTISFNHFQPFLTGIIDVSLAVQNAVIAANSLGIAYLVTNDTYTKDIDAIFKLLHLPEQGCFPLLYLCLGYKKEANKEQKQRLNMNHIVHKGKYKKFSPEEINSIILEYDNHAMELFTNWKEKGFNSYLAWFYDKWLPAIEKEENSNKILDILKNIRFLPK